MTLLLLEDNIILGVGVTRRLVLVQHCMCRWSGTAYGVGITPSPDCFVLIIIVSGTISCTTEFTIPGDKEKRMSAADTDSVRDGFCINFCCL